MLDEKSSSQSEATVFKKLSLGDVPYRRKLEYEPSRIHLWLYYAFYRCGTFESLRSTSCAPGSQR